MTARLKLARLVTVEHGEMFAAKWYEVSLQSLEICDAFGETKLVEWSFHDADAQNRYKDIEDEILERTFAAAKDVIGAAFIDAARGVLAREWRADITGKE